MTDQKPSLPQSRSPEKRAYQRPKLKVYGSIRELTQGAGGGFGDTGVTRVAFFAPPGEDAVGEG